MCDDVLLMIMAPSVAAAFGFGGSGRKLSNAYIERGNNDMASVADVC